MAAMLPRLSDVTHLFAMLFGPETVCTRRMLALSDKESTIVAAYRDNCGVIRRVLTCDIAFANSARAALSAIPRGSANEAIKSGDVPENIFMNLSEVMNIAVNLFTESFGGRLELLRVRVPHQRTDASDTSRGSFRSTGQDRRGDPAMSGLSELTWCDRRSLTGIGDHHEYWIPPEPINAKKFDANCVSTIV